MTSEKYQEFLFEAMKIRQNPKILSAIEKQIKLSEIVKKKAEIRFKIEDELFELYHSVPTEDINPALFGDPNLPEHERRLNLIGAWVNNDPRVNVLKRQWPKVAKTLK